MCIGLENTGHVLEFVVVITSCVAESRMTTDSLSFYHFHFFLSRGFKVSNMIRHDISTCLYR